MLVPAVALDEAGPFAELGGARAEVGLEREEGGVGVDFWKIEGWGGGWRRLGWGHSNVWQSRGSLRSLCGKSGAGFDEIGFDALA